VSSAPHITAISIAGQKKFLHESVGFTSHRDFLNRLDEMMTCQAQWQDTFVSEQRAGAEWGTDLKYWKRDPLAVLQEILENPALADKCVWRPRRVFNGEGSHVYGDMDTGEFLVANSGYSSSQYLADFRKQSRRRTKPTALSSPSFYPPTKLSLGV